MDEVELRAVIASLKRLGADHRTVELKKARGGVPTSLWETISAFANADGGHIMLGVDEADDFAVCGVIDPGAMESQVAAICADMEPVVRAEITTVYLDDKAVVVISIPPVLREQRPCHKRSLGEFAGSRLRVSDGDRKLTAYEVSLLLSGRSEPTDDLDLIAAAAVDDLNPNAVAAYLRRIRDRSSVLSNRSDAEILRMTNVIKDDEHDREVPTLAGLMAFGDYPQQFLPQLNITVAVYPTTELGALGSRGERLLDNRPIDGSIPVMAREAIRVLKMNMRRRSVVSGLVRTDEWEYPEEVLREALINALVHRDYSRSSRGTQVQVEVFPDRLTIRNPGGLYGPVEIGSLGQRTTSSTRNRALLKMMEDTPLDSSERMVCENRGTGIARMRRVLSDVGMEPPEFQDDISTFEVVFPNHTLLDQAMLDWLHDLDGRPLTRPQMTLLAAMRNDPATPATNSRFRELTGMQDSRAATRELGELVSRKILVQDGTRGSASYWLPVEVLSADVLMDEDVDEVQLTTSRALSAQQAAILDALTAEPKSRSELASEADMNPNRVASTLQTLRERGLIELVGKPRSKNAKWQLKA